MALQTKNSVLAIKKETTEGTPVSPTASSDYTALQGDFSMSPSFAVLENEELTGSIGMSKNVKGIEEPTFSFSHYLRHSGVEATAPDYAALLENAFGSQSIQATERDVVSSTVSSITVDTGEGVEYARGQAVLAKNASNDYEIRNALSVSGDVITMAQNFVNAPPATTLLGRSVFYSPVNINHPTHSLWLYRGNNADGVVEMMAGSRVTSMSIEATAGEFINANFGLDGLEYFQNPIEITATDTAFDFNDGSARAASITAKVYKDPYELAEALQSSMDGLSGDNITVTYSGVQGSGTGKFTVATDGATLSLLPATGPNTANEGWSSIGFGAADLTGATSYEAASAISKASPQSASFDSADPLVAKANQVLLSSSSSDITCFDASSISISLDNTKSDLLSVCSVSGKQGSVIQERTVSIEVSATLDNHQAQEFRDFRKNNNVIFTWNAGERLGNNWVPGKVVNVHSPTCVIDEFELVDNDGSVDLNMTLSTYVSSGLGEFFINLL